MRGTLETEWWKQGGFTDAETACRAEADQHSWEVGPFRILQIKFEIPTENPGEIPRRKRHTMSFHPGGQVWPTITTRELCIQEDIWSWRAAIF